MRIKFLLTKIGVDAHDRGVKAIAYGLRNAGMEVIYTGPWQKIEDVITTAVQEDVDILGVSDLGGDYILLPKLMQKLKQENINIPVVVGGIIPSDVEKNLKEKGVKEVFSPGTSMDDIVNKINEIVQEQRN